MPTSCPEASESLQSFQNSSNNLVNQRTQSTKKQKHVANWMSVNSKMHFSEKLLKTPDSSLPNESDKHDETILPTSPEIWICDTCLLSNKAPAVRCRGCDILKYGVILQSCKGNQSKEMTADRRSTKMESSIVATPPITRVTEMSTSLTTPTPSHMPGIICSAPEMYSSADTTSTTTEERMTMEFLPTGTECATVHQPTEKNTIALLSSVSIGNTEPDEKLFHAISHPAKSTRQDVNKEDNDQDPDEPVAKKACRIQLSSATVSFPHAFGPSPIYTTGGSLTLPKCTHYNVPSSTRSDMTTTAVSSKPLPFLFFGCSNRIGSNNINPETFASSVNFPSVFGCRGAINTKAMTNESPSSHPFTGMLSVVLIIL
ncbi:uncharacterized protein [Chiloscyllium punctatum]|uniref:uncharacterized protein n=1 Tax=Chiloscyllium punctatum TaxID=137246 RepID=UPI003B641AF2